MSAVLVPSAPAPFGGVLIYVPSEWIRPAEGGVERLMNVYVSMGVTPPLAMPSVFDVAPQPAKLAKRPKKPKSLTAD